MKSRLLAGRELLFFGILLIPILAIAFSTGPDPGLTGAPFSPDNGRTCTQCHGTTANSGPGRVTITAPASYTSGSSNTVTVTVSDPNQRRWGFELSARTAGGQQAGTLVPTDGTTQVKSLSGIQYIEHTNAPTTAAGVGATFSFSWQAPDVSTGPVTFYAAGNAANANFSSDSGDRIYTSSLAIQPQAAGPPPSVNDNGTVNSASFALGSLAPGTIATIFGTDLNDGSQVLESAFDNNGKLLTTLGGASVKFNGIAAPVFASFPTQLNVQIPEELAGSTSASVEVTVNGQTSPARTVPIGASLPGIYTLQSSGAGQGIVLFANSATWVAPQGSIPGREARPASPGDFLTIYCTGLGAVSNPPGTGRRASGVTLSTTIATPQVTIGGVPAEVIFSGLTPSLVGLFQVNVRVPAGAPPGPAVPLVLTIGGVQSNTVTIAVASGQSPSSNRGPTITSLSPSSVDLDVEAQTLTIIGTGFTPSSRVTLNGISKTPTYVSDTQLTIPVTSSDLTLAGDYPVVVSNPASGGASSNGYSLRVRQPAPDNPNDDYY